MSRFAATVILTTCVAILASADAARTEEPTRIKFTLDWKVQGPHAWFYHARDKGYFRDAGLDVTIDQGEGSATTVTRVLSGAYDAGFGDMNAIIQAAAQRPGEQPVMVYLIYNRSPFTLVTKADGPVRSLKDVEGHSLGVPAGSATHRMLTPLAKKNGVDTDKIKVVNVAPNLVEQLLMKGEVDVIASFAATTYFNVIAMRQNPEKDYRWFFYDQYGIDLYSNGVMVSKKLVQENPAAVRGLLRAINKALVEIAAAPDAGVATLKSVEPLLQTEIERARLVYFVKEQMITPETTALGIGDIEDKRMAAAIATVADAYQLPRKPDIAEVFDRSFLPPRDERALKAAQ